MKHVAVALDDISPAEAVVLAEALSKHPAVWGFKVHELFVRRPDIVGALKKFGNVFVDCKFHDIPHTVEHEVAAVVALGADLVTVHSSGGRPMLEAAVRAGGAKVAAVTLLTSLSERESAAIYKRTPEEAVRALAGFAADAGIRNIVCSPREVPLIRKNAPYMRIITPGIRSANDTTNDQSRTTTAQEALALGSDLLVIGRPITAAKDPVATLDALLNEEKHSTPPRRITKR